MTIRHILLRGLALALLVCPGAAWGTMWINEFHYDNAGADTGEFVEIVVGPDSSGVLPTDVMLTLYNGSTGVAYGGTHARHV